MPKQGRKIAYGALIGLGTALMSASISFAAAPLTYRSITGQDLYVNETATDFFGCIFSGEDLSHPLSFNSGGTSGVVSGGAALNIVNQMSPLDTPISSSLQSYLNAHAGIYTVAGRISGTGTCANVASAPDFQGSFAWSGGFAGSGTQLNDNTRFITPFSPPNGSTSSSTTIPFSATYFFNDVTSFVLDKVAFEISDMTSQTSPIRFGSSNINISGISTESATTTLVSGHLYLWRPVMYSSGGTSTEVYGDFYSLNVLYQSASSTPFVGATLGTSTLPDATNLLSFLNVPNLLVTKVPFAYLFQIAQGIQAGVSGSTTSAIPSGAFVWHGVNGSTTTIDMFSTSTIGYYLSPTLIGLWRAFLLVVLTVEFGYALYLRAKSQHLI